MNSYRNAVKLLSENSVKNEFSNKGPEHAAIVLEYMLKETKNEIRFFSGSFDKTVTTNTSFIKELDKFLSSGRKFYLFLESLPPIAEQSPALAKVIAYSKKSPNNIIYKIIPDEFVSELKLRFQSGNVYHYAVSDDSSYRIEIDKNNFKAICNFNDSDIALKLKEIFDNHFF